MRVKRFDRVRYPTGDPQRDEFMRSIARIWGVPLRLLMAYHRSGHRHRGTTAWANRRRVGTPRWHP